MHWSLAVEDLLQDVLRADAGHQGDTVRQHVFAPAERLEAELGPEQVAYDAGSQRNNNVSQELRPPVTVAGHRGGFSKRAFKGG